VFAAAEGPNFDCILTGRPDGQAVLAYRAKLDPVQLPIPYDWELVHRWNASDGLGDPALAWDFAAEPPVLRMVAARYGPSADVQSYVILESVDCISWRELDGSPFHPDDDAKFPLPTAPGGLLGYSIVRARAHAPPSHTLVVRGDNEDGERIFLAVSDSGHPETFRVLRAYPWISVTRALPRRPDFSSVRIGSKIVTLGSESPPGYLRQGRALIDEFELEPDDQEFTFVVGLLNQSLLGPSGTPATFDAVAIEQGVLVFPALTKTGFLDDRSATRLIGRLYYSAHACSRCPASIGVAIVDGVRRSQ